ncbi:hypothetical protein [Lederbergia galactosidilytica]|uniref:Uncharacterized protein n=1 Tax=Lederbergia galactosidilytica TaxID=217031 RepID=A0A177ZTI8_9BACI|nr:hypothetical protein [Lederbergia galactosidilytica]KRG13242.1 hypothetical protein ACA30_16790 [Virgibacillus soli]OAK71215.1 hypothetical protein ABB05_10710 [Lederbergia galactosidilytica]
MHFLQFGSLTIPYHWLIALLSLLIGWIEIKIFSKRNSLSTTAIEILMNTLFLWGVVWKLSMILFDFPTVKGHLFAILYFSGGSKGFYLGMIVSILYLFWKVKKEELWAPLSMIILHFGTVGYGFYFLLTSYLQEESFLSLASTLFIIILLTIWLWLQDKEQIQKRQSKAGIVFLIYVFIWPFSRETSWMDLSIPLLFPFLTISLQAIAIKKEKL